MPQQLAAKEAAQFRQVLRSYEEKQYKRGLKTADLILKKVPKHGETMAMKALILNGQGKTEEAFALGKEALTADMKSHICWHVYGILYRAKKNFEEAAKAYKFALKLEPTSAQIQRDLAALQVQMRDYQGFIQTRNTMLQARPQIRQSWTALALAHHLAGNLTEAENVITTFEGTLKTNPTRYDLEHSEAVMYKNSIIAEQGDYKRALQHLETDAKQNLDRLAVLESRAEYLLKLDRKEEAAKAYRALIDRNCEHATYYTQLTRALGIAEDDAKARKAVYEEYAIKYPRSDAGRRIPLDFLSGEDFRQAAGDYLALMLNKGVPSTFANLKHLYSNKFKKDTLLELAEDYLHSPKADSDSKDKGEAAALFYLAQHHNYHMSRDLVKAMEYIERAITKDNKSVDYHMTKARILKHSGNLKKASEMMDCARALDLKDRYINSKAAKYQLRNNQNEKALKTVGLFTRADTVGGPLADLLDMQCMWFLTEDGRAYARQGNIGLALKRFHQIATIFEVWQEDQFDFHGFSLRKGQIRAYVDMVRWEDHVFDHPFYTRAALDAISIYLNLSDKAAANANGEADSEALLAQKKALKKAKREQQRLERDAAEKQARQDPNKAMGPDGEPKKTDEDPLGLALAATTDPLGAAMKLLFPMLDASPKSIQVQLAGFEVFMRREKYVLALRCLNAAIALDSSHPKLHPQIVTFAKKLKTASGLPAKVFEVLKAEFTAVDVAADLSQYNADYQAEHKDSIRSILSFVAAERALNGSNDTSVTQLTASLNLPSTTFSDAIEVLETLKGWNSSEAAVFQEAAHAKFPEVTRLA
ncbi:Alpha-acetyltransferase 15, NatA [Cordyceps fumosorosea ARSEF 2679]|uniref:Alpha-acetyltransferase 15, NatA n=1 Tax=Cordyceps fumosorosea (strain ARSEF 2679) TaxID=1081104 RepID=A0A167LG81_CORFA|nr:Alpha-acetyltransferase 15, NatA [Cordyceps fumosorosea ARSEF 2679]OAA53054.1 Alpha-acetyltransferase 15, NatA [Cordyceps fumosorosea ARSEF 2679]